jgi:imidazolonepropionase-like amidohydrolase
MATTNPAALLGVPIASLRPGDRADLVLFRLIPRQPGGTLALEVQATIADGELVFGQVDA